MPGTVLSGRQLRAARALLGLNQRELAALAGVSVPTIHRLESSDGSPTGAARTQASIRSALDRAGVELLAENRPCIGSGLGVRLREPVLQLPT